MRALAGRHLREWVALLGLLLVLTAFAVRGDWLARADNAGYDLATAASGRSAADAILILAIDEASLAQVGRWPWSRQRLAEVVERLADAGAGPVLLDVILSEPQRDDPSADTRLAAAICRHGGVVLPVFMPSPALPAIVPLAPLSACARLGHAQALVDADGVSRRYLPLEAAAGQYFAHVALRLREREPALPAGAIGADEPARLVALSGPAGHMARLPVADLLLGRIPPERLRGKTVLVGATATGLGDTLVTPLAGMGGAMPGVEFVANIVDALDHGRQLGLLPPWVRLGLSLLVPALLMVVLLVASPRLALVATVGTVLASVGLAWAGLRWWGGWWPPAASALAAALAYPLWSWRRLEASLDTLARETSRMAALAGPAHGAPSPMAGVHFLDPVETRLAAISQAVDRVAASVALGDSAAETAPYREEMMRHLAHDLRAPLVSLRSLAEQLRGQDGAAHAAMLARTDACARRSLDLTEQFLLMGRAQSLESSMFTEVDLVAVLHQCADDLWEDAQSQGLRIARSCALDLALVHGDTRLLQRAVLNLGWNAMRHGPAGGVVTLSLEASEGRYLLAVHDQGTGFAPEQLDDLSRRHAQGQGPGAVRGHGLGLALVQLVAHKHGARLVAARLAQGGFSIGLHIVYI